MKLKYIVLLCVCLLIAAICVALNLGYQHESSYSDEDMEEKLDSIKHSVTETADTEYITQIPDTTENTEDLQNSESDTIGTEDTTEDATTSQQDPPEPDEVYVTMDFDALHRINPEICAWIEIDGTNIDYPVLQSVNNDKKYLSTSYDGSYYIGGAIFTEKTYNSTDFNDPVTMIYGHTMRSGNMFGKLQKTYSSKELFQKHSQIKLYLPDEVRVYTVFAAVPYSKIHILHTYDFSNEYWYNRFFSEVSKIREIGANFSSEITPEYNDRVIILSVCLNGDSARRYLVMAVLNSDLADNAG